MVVLTSRVDPGHGRAESGTAGTPRLRLSARSELENWTMTEPHLHWWSDDARVRVWWPYLALAVGVLVVAFGGILFSHAIS
jgi:hypothetical protein